MDQKWKEEFRKQIFNGSGLVQNWIRSGKSNFLPTITYIFIYISPYK